MEKPLLLLALALTPALAACSGSNGGNGNGDAATDEELPLPTAHIEYTVSYQGSNSNVVFDGEVPREVDGFCSIADSSDPTYPFLLSFDFRKGEEGTVSYQEIQMNALRIKAGLSIEILPCGGLSINHGGVEQQATLVECGDTAEGKCAFTGVSYDEQQNIVSGSFACGAFTTNTFATMEVTGGSFSLKNCER
jgi:hypothetical protein